MGNRCATGTLDPEAIRKALDGLEGVKGATLNTVTLEALIAAVEVKIDRYAESAAETNTERRQVTANVKLTAFEAAYEGLTAQRDEPEAAVEQAKAEVAQLDQYVTLAVPTCPAVWFHWHTVGGLV